MTSLANRKDSQILLILWNFSDYALSNDVNTTQNKHRAQHTQDRIPDETLVAASQSGDIQAFESLIVKYQRQIFNLIYQMTRNVEVVEDIGQDVFISAFKAIGNFKAKSSFFTWLYRIAINHCKNYLASAHRTQDVETRYRSEVESDDAPGDYERNPQNMLIAKEFVNQMEDALAHLPAEQRVVLTLCEFQGFSYQEIAEILECPVGTVRSRLARARAALQEHLNQYE